MILTGKCKEKFLEWNEEQDAPISTYAIKQGLINEVILNALIIEFFDSVKYAGFKSLWAYSFDYYDVFKDNWNEHIQQAIKKANDIYNERFK